MSIPPLVCSTPPPPDQCEDDKDPEDFDLSYSLSQEDDDDENNDYNYGNFSSYNHYQSATDKKSLEIKNHDLAEKIDAEVHKEILIRYEHSEEVEPGCARNVEFESNDINENKLKCEEDMNIEDLNLKLDEEIVTNVVENSDENESNEQNTNSLKDLNIPCNSNNSQDDDNTKVLSDETVTDLGAITKVFNVALEESIVEQSSEDTTKNETIAEDVDVNHLNDKNAESPINFDVPLETEETLNNSNDFADNLEQSSTQFDVHLHEKVIDDDFGDFDDFQFANTKNSVAVVVGSSNPWENNDSNESDFGSFTANFEENKVNTQDLSHVELRPIASSDALTNQVKEDESDLEDDDFGDFDDFKSSAVKTESNQVLEDVCQELPVLNLQSTDNEHHIMESITKVLTSVFIEEISEPDVEFEGKLESLLSETWGHLMETDEREPYIVNWNNSLGQKTLLKALCIDSRNILFGPKWSSHMPKYAANLSVAPLQPQKHASTSSNIVQSESIADKVSSKPTPTWSDPFTSDGQESCSSTEKESSTIPPRPTDLDVFEAAMSTKSDKIYASTLSVQPIRQINLPDTHIFTPTDSEIPRSKTIHYNHSPTVLLPQPIVANSKHATADPPLQNITSVVETNTDDDNEYWEFQNFKSTSDCGSLPNKPEIPEKSFETALTVNALPKASIAYESELLQPIKVEPSMPTLNWPDPGEVKAAYDDFTDFVSISSHSTDKQDSAITHTAKLQAETNNVIKYDASNDLKEKTEESVAAVVKPINEFFDDDFETFKSALPSKGTQDYIKTSSTADKINQIPLSRLTDFDNASPKSDNIKFDSISFPTMPRPNEVLTQNVGLNSNTKELTNTSSLSSGPQIQSSLLQPTPASFSVINTQNQRTSGQILQPLSLESYSQINWPSPGIDLQDLSRFNPVETLKSLKSDLGVSGLSKAGSPLHTQKNTVVNQPANDDGWGEFVSSKPKQQQSVSKKPPVSAEDDEWTDFISSPSVKPQNGLNTISLNVHTNSNIQKTVQNKFPLKTNQAPVDIPTLNYITPKTNPHKTYNDKHFQNL